MFDLWPTICITFFIYANLAKIKKENWHKFLNYTSYQSFDKYYIKLKEIY